MNSKWYEIYVNDGYVEEIQGSESFTDIEYYLRAEFGQAYKIIRLNDIYLVQIKTPCTNSIISIITKNKDFKIEKCYTFGGF